MAFWTLGCYGAAPVKWDYCIGNDPCGDDDTAVMWVKILFDRWGYRIDLHKIVRADEANCFHTHSAHALRVVLWGGYTEEIMDASGLFNSLIHRGRGYVGWVRWWTVHRIAFLFNGPSYSLWLRGRICARVQIGGWNRRGVMQLEEIT